MRLEQRAYVGRTSGFTVPQKVVEQLGLKESEYVEYCVKEVNSARAMLRSLFELTIQLRRNIINAASYAPLDETTLEALKQKMKEIQIHFSVTCDMLKESRVILVFATDPWW